MKTFQRSLIAVIALLGAALAPARAAEPSLPREGWSSWEVPAPEGTPFWCCWNHSPGQGMTGTPCKLDNRDRGYGSNDKSTTDAVRVYARTRDGKMDGLQVLAAACPVEAATPIQDLAGITPDESVRWLATRIRSEGRDSLSRDELVGQAVAAMAMHRGDVAGKELTGFALNDAREQVRKWSVFWLAVVRGVEGAEVVSSAMFNDKQPEVRKHAAFALTRSGSARVAADLIRQGNTDKDGDVRAQAWFWLAQTGLADAEPAIFAALRKDADRHVREHAVFALSQLPGDRSTKALIAAAEDRLLSREQRKKAVFWLSQSDADSAQAYLEKVLTRTAAQ